MFRTIAFIILLAVALAALYKIIKSVFKVLLIGALIIIVVVGTLGIMTWRDYQDYRSEFRSAPKLVLFTDDDKLLFAAVISEAGATDAGNVEERFRAGDKKGLRGEHYKLIYVDKSVLEQELPAEINGNSREELLSAISEADNTDEKLVSAEAAWEAMLEKESFLYLYKQHQGPLEIYPRTMLYAIIGEMPGLLVRFLPG